MCYLFYFREGSVVTNMTLVFRDASSVPDLNTAQSQLASALLTSNVLNYINGSLVVGKSWQTQKSSGSKIALDKTHWMKQTFCI